MFDLPRTDNGLADVQLEFALLDWDRVTKNEVRREFRKFHVLQKDKIGNLLRF